MNEIETNLPKTDTKSSRNRSVFWILFSLIFLIFFAIALPGIFGGKEATNAVNAIASLRTISYAQTSILEKEKKHCLSLGELFQAKLISEELSKGEKSGYRFQIIQSENNCEVTAQPISSSTGKRTFYIAEKDNWKFRFSQDKNEAANADSPFLSY